MTLFDSYTDARIVKVETIDMMHSVRTNRPLFTTYHFARNQWAFYIGNRRILTWGYDL